VQLEELSPAPAFYADLEIHGAYGQLRVEPAEGLSLDIGVRYEDAVQSVTQDLTIFTNVTTSTPAPAWTRTTSSRPRR